MTDWRAPYGWIPGRENYQPFRFLLECALFQFNLRVTCRICRRSIVLDGAGLWWKRHRARKSDELRVVAKMLKCRICRDAGIDRQYPIVETTREKAEIIYPGGPSRGEWKRIVNRQRS